VEEMKLKHGLITVAAVATLNLPNTFTFQKMRILPLVSVAYAQEKIDSGDRMGNGIKKENVLQEEFKKDLDALTEIKKRVVDNAKENKLTSKDAETIVNIWKRWQSLTGDNQNKNNIFATIREILISVLTKRNIEEEARQILRDNGILREQQKLVIPTKKIGSESITVELPRFTPIFTKNVEPRLPEAEPPEALLQGLNNDEKKEFIDAAELGLVDAFLGNNNDASKEGNKMADLIFEHTNGGYKKETFDRLGLAKPKSPSEAKELASEIEQYLRAGQILEAMNVDPNSNFSSAMYNELSNIFNNININMPMVTITFGLDGRIIETSKFYIDASVVANMLIMKSFRPTITIIREEKSGEIKGYTGSLESIGKYPAGFIIAPEIAAGFKLFKDVALEFRHTSNIPLGEAYSKHRWIGEFTLAWKDEGLVARAIKFPLAYGAAFTGGTDKSVKFKGTIAAGLGVAGNVGFAVFADLDWLIKQGEIPQQPLVIRPGGQLNISGHKVSAYAIVGPGKGTSIYGGGLGWVLPNGIALTGSMFGMRRTDFIKEKSGLGGTFGVEYRVR
jgi:hypothetical protein